MRSTNPQNRLPRAFDTTLLVLGSAMCAECVQRSLLSVIRDFLIRNDQYLQRYVEVAYLEYRTVTDVHNVNVRHEKHCGAIRTLTRPKLFTHRELQMMMLAGACFIRVTDGQDLRGFLSG